MKTENIIDKVFESTLNNCDSALNEFRQKHSALIDELIQANRYDDLCKVLFRQGFLDGMVHGRKMRDEIIDKF